MKTTCNEGPSPGGEAGFVTLEFVLAVCVAMVVLVAVTNFVVFEYGNGVVHAAVDQGVREGARSRTPVAACQDAASRVIADLLGGRSGSMGGGVHVSCTAAGGQLDAVAKTRFRAWLRPIPDWSFTTTATARVEVSP